MQSNINPSRPLVSIVVTSFNRGHLVEKAIQSAIDQDYENLEIIISDNCSQDNTKDIVEKFLDDPRIHFFQNETNIGMIENFKHASFNLASGTLITYLSSDDYLINPSFISDAVKAFNLYPNIGIVHSRNLTKSSSSDTLEYDYSYLFYKPSFYKKDYVYGRQVFQLYPKCHSISFGGSMFQREDIENLDPFHEGIFSFDACIALQLIQKYNVCFLDKDTYVVRRHGKNFTSNINKASVYIDNVEYINKPFDLAVKNKFAAIETLNLWRAQMYKTYFRQVSLSLYLESRLEYKNCLLFLKNSCPAAFRELIFSPNFHFQKMLLTNPILIYLRNILLKAKHLYKKAS
jgi:glycosyltransferase involved in cell wall biosynthesis